MKNDKFIVSFPETKYEDILVEKDQNLAECCSIDNSPIMFGCRTGICGTCLVFVTGDILPVSEMEREVLETIVPDRIPSHIPDIAQPRLACQLELTNNIAIYTDILTN